MSGLLPITQIDPEQVYEAIRLSLTNNVDLISLESFLGRIDWSGADKMRPPVADLIDDVEAWASEYEEGAITRTEFVSAMRRLLPPGGLISVTLTALSYQAHAPLLDRSDELPQTGSGAQDDPASLESESDTVRLPAPTH